MSVGYLANALMELESETGFEYEEDGVEPIGFQEVLVAEDSESGEVVEVQMYEPDIIHTAFNYFFTSYEEESLKVKSGIKEPGQVRGYMPVQDFEGARQILKDEGFDVAVKFTGSNAFLTEL